jgi:hypothetical protein
LLMVDGFVVRWFPTSTIRFSAETSTAFNLPPQLPRTPDSTLAQPSCAPPDMRVAIFLSALMAAIPKVNAAIFVV